MDSKWRLPALQVARWGLQHGDFFDLYDVASQFGMTVYEAGKVMYYLRSLLYVEKHAETRRCKPVPGRMSGRRIFIKVLAIHPEPAKALSPVQDEACLGQRSACSSLMCKRWVYL